MGGKDMGGHKWYVEAAEAGYMRATGFAPAAGRG